MEHAKILAELLIEVLKSLPNDCIFYTDRTLDDLYNEGGLQNIDKYVVQIRNFEEKRELYQYDFAINLFEECISYLISELRTDPYIMSYFINYGIVKDGLWYLEVIDSMAIHILETVQISDKLFSECERDEDIFLSFEKPEDCRYDPI